MGLVGELSGEPVVFDFAAFGVLFEGPEFYFWVVGYFPGGDLYVIEHADGAFDRVSEDSEETLLGGNYKRDRESERERHKF